MWNDDDDSDLIDEDPLPEDDEFVAGMEFGEASECAAVLEWAQEKYRMTRSAVLADLMDELKRGDHR